MHQIEVTDIFEQGLEEAIGDGLNQFNDDASGENDRKPLAVVVRDPETGKVIGGMIGRSSLGLLFADLFYLPPALRGDGLGSERLKRLNGSIEKYFWVAAHNLL